LIILVKEQKEEICKLKEFKNEVSLLLRNYIYNLDSLIVNNNVYNSYLKNWINPKSKLKANLLYRLSRDGPEISTFHKLCDNKGPTLTLFDLKNGYKVGFYAKESVDSVSGWKNDDYLFIFNLNQNKKYKKINNKYKSIYCAKNSGSSANGLGCNDDITLNYVYSSRSEFLDKLYEKGSQILPEIKNYEVEYEVLETEIFQILVC